MNNTECKKRISEIREEIMAQRVSYGELLELYSLREYIDPSDIELMQWVYDEDEFNALIKSHD